MKFKKVEIQAFRAYTTAKDGTFDFSVQNGSETGIADFISLYAPNGFGKTSFYDAVEYGFTNSIDRFLKGLSLKEVAKSERSVAENKTGQYILRNRFAPESLKSQIKIYTTNSNSVIEKEIPPNKQKNSTDFHFDGTKVKNKFFQTVILSQEWIDAFLKLDDPSHRYEKFMEWFGDKENAAYYKRLVELINENDKQIDDIKKLQKGIQKELDFNGDKDILKKLNDKIVELKNSGESLKQVDESYSNADALNMSNMISERLSDLGFEILQLENRKGYVDLLFSGNDDIKGIDSYYDTLNHINEFGVRRKELNEVLGKFLAIEKNIIELQKLSETHTTYSRLKDDLAQLEEKFPSFLKVSGEIDVLDKSLEEERSRAIQVNKNLLDGNLQLSDLESKIKGTNTRIVSQQQAIAELQSQRGIFQTNSARKIELDKVIQTFDEQLKLITQTQQDLEHKLLSDRLSLDNISKQVYAEIENDAELKEINEKIRANQSSLIELISKRQSHDSLEVQINNQQDLNKDIQEFIARGLELINKSSTSTCLLCTQQYDSFNDLSERVSNNSFLSSTLAGLLNLRNELEEDIKKLVYSVSQNDELLLAFFNRRVFDREHRIRELTNEHQTISQQRQKLSREREVITDQDHHYQKLLSGSSYEQQLQGQKDLLKLLEDELGKATLQKNSALLLVQGATEDVGKIQGRINSLLQANAELSKDADFLMVKTYFAEFFSNDPILVETIQNAINHQNRLMGELTERISELLDANKTLEDQLINTTKEVTEGQIELIQKSDELLQQLQKGFEREVESKFNIVMQGMAKNDLVDKLNAISADASRASSKLQLIVKDYRLLQDLKTNVEPYLQYAKSQKTATELKNRRSFLEKKVKKVLEDERTKTAAYLDKQIKSFFYEDLINDLYRRIDPHPDYKKIRFNCDFKEDKPRLNVFLYKDDADMAPIIPNLYFSTAQLNILSLSIFLAKALNAKDDEGNQIDCIFIDDPIQSMDSINILSTIDLLRSLVINNGKQVILSTHDENFHNLLKKKMPAGLFNSKFLELETFGKLRN